MSGKHISKTERKIITGNRRYIKNIRHAEKETFGYWITNPVKDIRAVARIGK